jgi:hypothetical protein
VEFRVKYISADGLERIEKCGPTFHFDKPTIRRALTYPLCAYAREFEGVPDAAYVDKVREYEYYTTHESSERIVYIYRELKCE